LGLVVGLNFFDAYGTTEATAGAGDAGKSGPDERAVLGGTAREELLTPLRVRSHDSLWNRSEPVIHGIDDWHMRKVEELRKILSGLPPKRQGQTYALASVSLIYESEGVIVITPFHEIPLIFSSSKKRNALKKIGETDVHCIDSSFSEDVFFKLIYKEFVKGHAADFDRNIGRSTGYMQEIFGISGGKMDFDELHTIFSHAEQSCISYIKKNERAIAESLASTIPSSKPSNITAARIDIVLTNDMCPPCHLTMKLFAAQRFAGYPLFIGVTGMREHELARKGSKSSRNGVTIMEHPNSDTHLAIKMV
jgi:hypothetical protein